MNWLRFAAICVYCFGTILVPGLHRGLHEAQHASGASHSSGLIGPGSCVASACGCLSENPYAARRARLSIADEAQQTGENQLAGGNAETILAGLRQAASAHQCSETCVVCLATSVFGNAFVSSQPIAVTAIAESCSFIDNQNRRAQVCARESVPRGPPITCCEIFV